MYKIYPEFEFWIAYDEQIQTTQEGGEVLYDRDGEIKGFAKTRQKTETVGYGGFALIRAQIARKPGDRYQPPHPVVIKAEVLNKTSEAPAEFVVSSYDRLYKEDILQVAGQPGGAIRQGAIGETDSPQAVEVGFLLME